ncbi:helix-turn-helix transcriptional regulator [Paraflavitalea sp. CAU 1676]|uniref:AraC family transcriptional regulator n=1 Tax=Paraflavitalea sp. CAU 1676 TaxID=3032598 RepID=UPI0023DCA5F2|nr:helix-turn-helix transcriptional regulator [Paraflavitalea sp. CAU 1676]MDF2187325.1 helix-turn-helix transcriptional regulator [Paraflavitalea sp. CAU 1676]
MAVTPVLDIGKTAANTPFEIHTMDWIAQNRFHQNELPHRHSYFVIIWVKSGSGVHFIDVDKYELENNTVYCLTPGQIHQLKVNGPVDGYVISFTADFITVNEDNINLLFNTGLFYTFSHSPVIHVSPEMEEDMKGAVDKMLKEYSNFFLLRSEILRGYLKIFLIYLTRQFEGVDTQAQQPRNVELAKKFLSLLEQQYTTKKMVADYADQLAVTPNYLNEVVKKVSGFPASHHIQQRIILEAKRQAAYSEVSMKEIAWHLGFDDVAHFSKFFKNVSGTSFSDFRKEIAVR